MPTKIEWTDETWNPITGCTKIGPGCKNCYAERMARRLAGRFGYPEAPHHFDVTLHPDRLEQPLKWRKPRMVFMCSMGDLFHKNVLDAYIIDVLRIIAMTPHHIYQILTKRPEVMKASMQHFLNLIHHPVPLSNAWLGVSVENQAAADKRRECLRQTSAAVKFVSYEPALAPVDWTGWEFVDQIISGDESGPGARPSSPNWHRATRDFCQEHGIAYFHKQNGEWLSIDQTGHLLAPGQTWADIGMKVPEEFVFEDGTICIRVGKKRAGRLLDGVLWEEYPK